MTCVPVYVFTTSLFHALDLRAEGPQLFINILISALDLTDIADRGLSFGREGSQKHGHASTNIGAFQVLAI